MFALAIASTPPMTLNEGLGAMFKTEIARRLKLAIQPMLMIISQHSPVPNMVIPPHLNQHLPLLTLEALPTLATTTTPVLNKRLSTNPIAIRNPNGTIMYSSHEGELNLPTLPPDARHIHIVPNLQSDTLLSIGQMCDAGCTVHFNAKEVSITSPDGKTIHGERNADTKLWKIPLPPIKLGQSNAAIGMPTTADRIAFTHAALFLPALSTLEQALKRGFLTNFPGLTPALLQKYPPQSIAMIKGHMDQARKNQQSTRTTTPTLIEEDEDIFVPTTSIEQHTHLCYATLMQPTGQIYTDQTGRFVTPSSSGNQYLMILYDYDSNAILVEPKKTQTVKAILTAFKTLNQRLCKASLTPKLQ